MNILLLNHYAGSPEHGMEFRPYNFATEWIKTGHKVKIVAGSYSHIRQKNETFKGISKETAINGVQYFWVKTNRYDGNGVKRAISMFAFILKTIFKAKHIIDGFKPDVVIASSTYPLDIYAAQYLANKVGAKLIFEVHDIWPLTPMELSNLSSSHPFIKFLQIAEDRAYRVADEVVSMLPCAKSHMLSRGMDPNKYNHIPNGIVIKDWQSCHTIPMQHHTLLNSLKQNNKFIIGYAGGHAVSNALEVVVWAASLVKNSNIEIVLVGDGVEKSKLVQLATKLSLNNIHFLPSIPKAQIPSLLSRFDVCLISWNYSSLYRFGVSPNKVFDYMMAQKPIIQALEAGNDMITDASCGISIKPQDHKALAQAFQQMYEKDDDQLQELGMNGYNFVIKNHDICKLANDFVKLM